jgi:hypothetical protein
MAKVWVNITGISQGVVGRPLRLALVRAVFVSHVHTHRYNPQPPAHRSLLT